MAKENPAKNKGKKARPLTPKRSDGERAVSSVVEQEPFKLLVQGSNP